MNVVKRIDPPDWPHRCGDDRIRVDSSCGSSGSGDHEVRNGARQHPGGGPPRRQHRNPMGGVRRLGPVAASPSVLRLASSVPSSPPDSSGIRMLPRNARSPSPSTAACPPDSQIGIAVPALGLADPSVQHGDQARPSRVGRLHGTGDPGADPCSTSSVARTATTDSVSAARRCRRRPSSTQSNLNSGAYPPAPSTTTCASSPRWKGRLPALGTAPALPASNQASRRSPTCRTRPPAARSSPRTSKSSPTTMRSPPPTRPSRRRPAATSSASTRACRRSRPRSRPTPPRASTWTSASPSSKARPFLSVGRSRRRR